MSFRDPAESEFSAAVALHRAGKLDRAEAKYKVILLKDPKHFRASGNLAAIRNQQGDPRGAIVILKKALALAPDVGSLWNNLANAANNVQEVELGLDASERALQFLPKNKDVWVTRSAVLFSANRLVEARLAAESALALDPNDPSCKRALVRALYRQGLIEEALDLCDGLVRAGLVDLELHSQYLFYAHFSPRYSLEELFQQSLAWARHFRQSLERPLLRRSGRPWTPGRQLQVGFVSSDLVEHPVSYFLVALVENLRLDHGWSPVFYSNGFTHSDYWSGRLNASGGKWVDVSAMSDKQFADRVRDDDITILFDLNGHTGRHRLSAFARRIAPIQASWIGYFDTTGLDEIDFLVGDRICIPPESEKFFAESIVRMPNDFLCYAAPILAPQPSDPPSLKNNFVTFGSANQITKVSDEVVDLWADLLNSVPGARLRLRTKALDDEESRDRLLGKFVARSVEASRIDLIGRGSQLEILEFYNTIDVALDPFPCAGGTTTCEALWMGVPVVSLLGERFCGRHSASHLHNAGVGELVVTSKGAYLQLGQALAADRDRLLVWRRTLRAQMTVSPLMDAKRFADDFAKMLGTMVRKAQEKT